jgi:hypothetical protein
MPRHETLFERVPAPNGHYNPARAALSPVREEICPRARIEAPTGHSQTLNPQQN